MRLPRLSHAVLLVPLALSIGCGGDASPGRDTASPTDATSDATTPLDTSDAATSGDATSDATGDVADVDSPDGPILERPSSDRYTCSEALAPTQPAVKDWSAITALTVDGEAWVLQSGDGKTYFGEVGADATVGTRYELATTAYSVSTAAALAHGTAVTLVWTEYGDSSTQTMSHAVVDTKTGVVVAPHSLPAEALVLGGLRLAANGDTAALAWSSGDSDSARVRFARVDDDGFVGSPVDVTGNVTSFVGLGPALAAYRDGFAIAWSEPKGGDPSNSELWFALLDKAGQKTRQPARISQAGGDGHGFGTAYNQGASPMLVVGDEVWIAYTESWQNGDFTDTEGATDIFIARIDADGGVTRYPFDRSVIDINQTQPNLFAFGDAVGVSWTSGTAIYICAGCYVDYDLHVALVDPATMGLAAAPLTHTHNAHGYTRAQTLALGDDVMNIAWQDFHALGFPVVSVAHCAAKR